MRNLPPTTSAPPETLPRLSGMKFKRACDVQLGDTLLLPTKWKNAVDMFVVTEVRLVGDDVEFNDGQLSTSLGNVFALLDCD